MSWARLKEALRSVCLCLDSVRLLDWIRRHRLETLFFTVLRYRVSPLVLLDALAQDVDEEERGRLFALGASMLRVGGVYKTTGLKRTVLADRLALRLARGVRDAALLEVGVSDGSSSLELLARGRVFSRIVLTDRFSRFYARKGLFGTLFLDAEDRLYAFKFLFLYILLPARPARRGPEAAAIEVVNPLLTSRHGLDRITRFNMFTDALDLPVDIIKCANILNKAYFSEQETRAAVSNLCRSLKEGGRIVVSQNNAKYASGEAGFVLRKSGAALRLESCFNNHDLADLFRRGGARP